MASAHSFHIPVMGIGFTIDTPLKVSHWGIDSVISLVDDGLLERLRKKYSELNQLAYEPISDRDEDARANRITAYLDMLHVLTQQKWEQLINDLSPNSDAVRSFLELLPNSAELVQKFNAWKASSTSLLDVRQWISDHASPGRIDVNIMTKVDGANFSGKTQLGPEFNDAHAAVRGYANSMLESTLVLSAGMSPRLYGYLAQFEDFFADATGFIKKKIALKVSDYRSALIQGKFLAKKGIWVSEYRIESGLNCGGHAFATDGYLMGPILAEFRDNRDELIQSVHSLLQDALASQSRPVPESAMDLRITAQGGVGTAEEHQFLIDTYGMDSVGWGSPFLLVPEATTVDDSTRNKLAAALEPDLYLSGISPLGVPFNNLRGNSKDESKLLLANKGKPGSSCPKKYLASNTEFTEEPICTASRQYQHLKLKELGGLNLSPKEFDRRFNQIVEKSCICVGLGTSALLVNELSTKIEGPEVSICPGPNLAYFDRAMTLKDMVDHIYGRSNVISRTDRPHMFVKELRLYVDYLAQKSGELEEDLTDKSRKFLHTFASNLQAGIAYYQALFEGLGPAYDGVLNHLRQEWERLDRLGLSVENVPG